jgi:hypothetical protein
MMEEDEEAEDLVQDNSSQAQRHKNHDKPSESV